MTATFIQVPPDSTGKKMAAESWTQGADTVHGEKLLICDASGNVVGVTANRLQVDGSGVTQPVSGPLTDTQLRASNVGVNVGNFPATQPVSAASLPLPSGAAQEHATAGSPHSVRLSDGTTFIIAASQADVQAVRDRLPAALDADGGLKAHIQNFPATQPVSGTFWQATQPVSGPLTDTQLRASAVPVSMATQTPDTVDRAAREVGRVRVWDGADEATVLALRAQPATTEKGIVIADLPVRIPTYAVVTATITPAITVGVKEGLAIFHPSSVAQDIYIVEIWVTTLVTTASTAGRSTVRVSTMSTVGTGGTNLTAADLGGAGASALGTAGNLMTAKTGGGTLGTTFIRREWEWPTQPVGRISETIFAASNPGNGIILRGGANAGISIDLEREVAHTALVDVMTIGARWLEL